MVDSQMEKAVFRLVATLAARAFGYATSQSDRAVVTGASLHQTCLNERPMVDRLESFFHP